MLAASVAFSQSKPPIEGPAVGETPAWFLQGSFPDPTGRTIVEPGGKVTVPARAGGAGGRGAGGRGAAARGRRISCCSSTRMLSLALVRAPWRHSAAVVAARPMEADARLHVRRIHMYFRPGSAACRRLRSTRKGISGCFSAQTKESRSSSSSIRTTSSSFRWHPT